MHHVIIGAGPAGVVAAESLRKADSSAKITILGKESEPPYSRMAIPYKLKGKIEEEGMYLRHDPEHFKALDIDVRQCNVDKINPESKTLELSDGSQQSYDKLLIATGATPLTPPVEGMELPGVHKSWTMDDMRGIESLATKGAKVVQIGAGFIACTNMEGIVARGVDLTIVEMEDRMVPRMMDEIAGNMIKDWCISQGVNVLTNGMVTSIKESTNSASRYQVTVKQKGASSVAEPVAEEKEGGGFFGAIKKALFGGEPEVVAARASEEITLDADLVIVATGVRANIGFLEGTGISVDQGILINERMETSVADIYAAGDCAQGKDFSTGEQEVHAIQPVAVEHGRFAAQNMLGRSVENPGSLNMNVLDAVGLISCSYGLWMGVEGGDSVKVVEKDLWRYLNLQFDGDVLVGTTAIGVAQHMGAMRGLIQMRVNLGEWKAILMEEPARIMEAYLALTQSAVIK
ncbi:MAG: NAD(P)/FAD-dependent oxidoreductase [Gammaproteobacteria bacterium]|nr:MAG: NAD(P)/FAD-dependent oxidoreductase [Gammaproteobacteria bacterium]